MRLSKPLKLNVIFLILAHSTFLSNISAQSKKTTGSSFLYATTWWDTPVPPLHTKHTTTFSDETPVKNCHFYTRVREKWLHSHTGSQKVFQSSPASRAENLSSRVVAPISRIAALGSRLTDFGCRRVKAVSRWLGGWPNEWQWALILNEWALTSLTRTGGQMYVS